VGNGDLQGKGIYFAVFFCHIEHVTVAHTKYTITLTLKLLLQVAGSLFHAVVLILKLSGALLGLDNATAPTIYIQIGPAHQSVLMQQTKQKQTEL